MSRNSSAPCLGSVLVVDDIPANRNLLREILEPCGYEVLLAADGETALTVTQRAQPDLVLLDVIMPGLDGFATCRRLKQVDATKSIPVIFLTAKDEPRAVLEGFASGGVDYITPGVGVLTPSWALPRRYVGLWRRYGNYNLCPRPRSSSWGKAVRARN